MRGERWSIAVHRWDSGLKVKENRLIKGNFSEGMAYIGKKTKNVRMYILGTAQTVEHSFQSLGAIHQHGRPGTKSEMGGAQAGMFEEGRFSLTKKGGKDQMDQA